MREASRLLERQGQGCIYIPSSALEFLKFIITSQEKMASGENIGLRLFSCRKNRVGNCVHDQGCSFTITKPTARQVMPAILNSRGRRGKYYRL